MKNELISKSNNNTQNIKHNKQVSLIILRLEIDDLNITDSSISNSSNIFKLFNYKSSAYLNKKVKLNRLNSVNSEQSSEINNLEQYSEKFSNKKEALKLLIGKRQSHLIRIETFYFDKLKQLDELKQSMFKTQDSNNNTNESDLSGLQSQEFVANAMTMQAALETAYNDWNKEKENLMNMNNNKEICTELNSIENIQIVDENENLNKKCLDDISLSNTNSNIQDSSVTKKEEINEVIKNEPENISKLVEEKIDDIIVVNSNFNSLIETETPITKEISFYYGNPAVDIVKGFIHIYKDCNLTPLDDSESMNLPTSSSSSSSISNTCLRSELLCMIGIPASISCNELLGFLMPFNENIEYMRIIRDTYPNQYMALIKLKSQKEADVFYLHNNNRRFNSIEDNVCHLVYVERIEAINSSKGASLPISGFTELPTCYICLERMDESLNGVITILCNHSFHANCLSKYMDTCCPVCRYSQTPEYTLDNTCSECGSHENLWICLICGHIGCGRYVRGHAYNHFQLTQHTYSMQLGSNQVWDYAADNYVHRLIQNKTDGKLVQLDEGGRIIHQDEKMDSITLEYTYLLTSQLESQRLFFEERIDKIEEKSELQLRDLEAKSKQSETENAKLKENLTNLSKEKSALEKKCSTLNTKLIKLQSELNEEKELNKCLSSNQEIYQTKLNQMEENLKKLSHEKDAEIQELKSQLRDIMFYLDAQNKFSESKNVTKEELDQSHMIIQQDQASGSSSNQTGKTNRRRKK